MLVAHEHMASHSASALVSRADAGMVARMPVCPQPWQPAIHANVHAIEAIFAVNGIDSRTGGEGKASKQMATGAYLLPATATTGAYKFRLRRPRIPSP